MATNPGTDGRISWADCLAALRAGERPASFLPRGAGASDSPPPELPELKVPPTAHLYQRVEGPAPRTFQLVYLRPPSTLWDHVDDARKGGGLDASNIFDGELDVDVIGMFRPRFVDPPDFLLQREENACEAGDERSNRASGMDGANASEIGKEVIESDDPMLEEEGSKNGDNDVDDDDDVENVDVADSTADAADYSVVADKVLAFLSNPEDGTAISALSKQAQHLSSFEWSIVYARVKEKRDISARDIVALLHAARSAALGEMVLCVALEGLIVDVGGHGAGGEGEELVALNDVARVAAKCCVDGGRDSAWLREQMQNGLLTGSGVQVSAALLAACLAFSEDY